jgi:hypothetical protein
VSVDYRQLYPKIQNLVQQIEQAADGHRRRCESALQALQRFSDQSDFLNERIEQALAQEGKTLRCAKPFDPILDQVFPLPTVQNHLNLAAADGSQMLPDRHAELYFGMINVGGITLPQTLHAVPQEISRSEFWYSDTDEFIESLFNFRRDVLERKLLLEISLSLPPPRLALMDGPLELWMEYQPSDENGRELKRLLQIYCDTLETFRQQGILLSGYVDRPESAYVVRLLELATATAQDWADLRRFRPFKGVLDADLFGSFLRPGERSAIFCLQSPLMNHFPKESEVCFFYLRVGRETEMSLARVELPLWVARDAFNVDRIHAELVSQCRQSGAYAYPYLLHRAHEVAVVRAEDRETILRALAIELQRHGYPAVQLSHKQALKNLPLRQKSALE